MNLKEQLTTDYGYGYIRRDIHDLLKNPDNFYYYNLGLENGHIVEEEWNNILISLSIDYGFDSGSSYRNYIFELFDKDTKRRQFHVRIVNKNRYQQETYLDNVTNTRNLTHEQIVTCFKKAFGFE